MEMNNLSEVMHKPSKIEGLIPEYQITAAKKINIYFKHIFNFYLFINSCQALREILQFHPLVNSFPVLFALFSSEFRFLTRQEQKLKIFSTWKKKSCCGQVLDVGIENIIWELIFQTTWTVECDMLAWRNWKRSPIDLLSSSCSLPGKIACLFGELLRCPLPNLSSFFPRLLSSFLYHPFFLLNLTPSSNFLQKPCQLLPLFHYLLLNLFPRFWSFFSSIFFAIEQCMLYIWLVFAFYNESEIRSKSCNYYLTLFKVEGIF